METATEIAKRKGLRIRTREPLQEIHYGEWQGRALNSLYRTKAWMELRANPGDFRFPGGETPREAQLRIMDFLGKLAKDHKGEIIVAVSHADIIRVAVAGYLGLAIDLYDRISIAPASVTTLSIGEGKPRLLNLGVTHG